MVDEIKKHLTALVAFILIMATPIASQAATLVLGDPTGRLGPALPGGDKVDVNGLFYDVRLNSVTCFDLYNGCDPAFYPFENADQIVEIADGLAAVEAFQVQIVDVYLNTIADSSLLADN